MWIVWVSHVSCMRTQKFDPLNWREEINQLEHPYVDVKIALKWILREIVWGDVDWNNMDEDKYNYFEHGNEQSIKRLGLLCYVYVQITLSSWTIILFLIPALNTRRVDQTVAAKAKILPQLYMKAR